MFLNFCCENKAGPIVSVDTTSVPIEEELTSKNAIVARAASTEPRASRVYEGRIVAVPIIMISFKFIFIGVEVKWSHLSCCVS